MIKQLIDLTGDIFYLKDDLVYLEDSEKTPGKVYVFFNNDNDFLRAKYSRLSRLAPYTPGIEDYLMFVRYI